MTVESLTKLVNVFNGKDYSLQLDLIENIKVLARAKDNDAFAILESVFQACTAKVKVGKKISVPRKNKAGEFILDDNGDTIYDSTDRDYQSFPEWMEYPRVQAHIVVAIVSKANELLYSGLIKDIMGLPE